MLRASASMWNCTGFQSVSCRSPAIQSALSPVARVVPGWMARTASPSRPRPAINRKYRSPARPSDTRRVCPAAMMSARRSIPPGKASSRAITLEAPPGHTASGVGVPTIACIASWASPSPPWTITTSVLAWMAAAVSRTASAAAAAICGMAVTPRRRSASTMRVTEW